MPNPENKRPTRIFNKEQQNTMSTNVRRRKTFPSMLQRVNVFVVFGVPVVGWGVRGSAWEGREDL